MNPRLVVICLGLVMAAAAVSAGAGSAHAFQGEPDGYNGISWGAPLDGLSSMEYVGRQNDEPDTELYRRSGDDLTFGKARLTAVEYGFTNGQLSMVTLRVNSLLQYLLMKEEAIRRFGPGKEADPHAERYIWEGERTTVRLKSAFDMS
jgi:hypothetical protein